MSSLLQFGMRLDRERFVALLARMGDPHKQLRCVHVAGTNGKGSTTTFIASALTAAGYKTGSYLSPYVFDLRERILIDARMIPTGDFARWVSTIRPEIEWIRDHTDFGETTEFELKTAVAFCYFAEQAVDFAVIEVGIGGRLDATNVIDAPLVAVITTIGLDHTLILGDSVEKIAWEKAGILKPGTFCVTGVPPGPARNVIAAVAAERGVPIEFVPAADGIDDEPLPPLALRGPFQRGNASLASAALRTLRERHGVRVSPGAVRAGLSAATLPGRFQIVRAGAPALVLDVAHNEDGGRVLGDALQAEFPGRPCVFVVGMTRNHEPEPFLRMLAPNARRVIATAPGFRPQPAGEIAVTAARLGLPVTVVEPARDAIQAAWDTARPDEVVVVTGSFYTVGETPVELRRQE